MWGFFLKILKFGDTNMLFILVLGLGLEHTHGLAVGIVFIIEITAGITEIIEE